MHEATHLYYKDYSIKEEPEQYLENWNSFDFEGRAMALPAAYINSKNLSVFVGISAMAPKRGSPAEVEFMKLYEKCSGLEFLDITETIEDKNLSFNIEEVKDYFSFDTPAKIELYESLKNNCGKIEEIRNKISNKYDIIDKLDCFRLTASIAILANSVDESYPEKSGIKHSPVIQKSETL